jgi:AAA+ superfamily predicted ATPase
MGGSDALNAVGARRSTRQDLQEVTNSLIAEFDGRLPAGTVIRCVARSRQQLLASGVRSGLPVAAEAMARLRLSELLPAHRRAG